MVKPYSCVVCGWRFHLLHNMQRHLATHKTQDKVPSQAEKLIISHQTFPLTPHFSVVYHFDIYPHSGKVEGIRRGEGVKEREVGRSQRVTLSLKSSSQQRAMHANEILVNMF